MEREESRNKAKPHHQGRPLRADLSRVDLTAAQLVETNLENTNLAGCRIYGISAGDLKLEGAKQADLIITHDDQPVITVDNLEVAQFIYLLHFALLLLGHSSLTV
jgi:uncharacterized protein YjbI with pentapeptide repeats